MSKKEAYYELVKWNHDYYYGESFNDFLERSVEQVRVNGWDPPACMGELHDAVAYVVRASIPKKE